MAQMFEIPQISFTKAQYDNKKNEIVLNLNDYRWLDELINDFQCSHRRIIPQLNLTSPTGTMANFVYPRMDGWEIVFSGKKCNVRLTYK